LSGADLRGADLSGANLSGANLSEADLIGARLPHFFIIPEEGSFVAWKKLRDGVLCKVEIPADAKRTSSLVGRKCRAEFVQVLAGEGHGQHCSIHYIPGQIVRADWFDDDIRVECSHGIHFFITQKEAEEY
jgi:hypothetical protein